MDVAMTFVKKENLADILCIRHSEMMHEFSRRCINRLEGLGAFRLFISPFQHFLEANVMKEIEKDALIIGYAAASFEAGRGAVEVEVVFERTKDVDRAFLEKLPVPFRLNVRYDDFKEIRKQRIAALMSFVGELVKNQEGSISFPDLLKKTFTESRFREIIFDMFHLYNLETRMVGNSIALPPPARRVKDALVAKLFAEMEQAARDIADEYVHKIYNGAAAS